MLAVKECFTTDDTGQTYKVVSIFAKMGTNILKKKKLCEVEGSNGERIVVKAKNSGVISKVLVKINDVVKDGSCIMEIAACVHPALMGNICCDCGMVLEEGDMPKSDTVSMLHSVPDLKIAKGEAEELGKKDQRNLLDQRRLVLLVDLDQTLIHTTNDNIPPELKDVYHFQLHPAGAWYHTRLRPHTKEFLEKISRLYELHICTFGVREYAHYIAHFLDPDSKLFGQRILSRNECIDPMSKKANLNSLFPCGDNMVCIIDDRTDVWNYSPNVVQVVPYHFFRHTGDINAPQGLQKKENDDRQGIDFKSFGKESSKETSSPDSQEASDEEFDKRTYSSDSDSDKDSKVTNQEVEVDSADSDKISDDSAVDVHTDEAEMRDEDLSTSKPEDVKSQKTEICKNNGDIIKEAEKPEKNMKEEEEKVINVADSKSEDVDSTCDKPKNESIKEPSDEANEKVLNESNKECEGKEEIKEGKEKNKETVSSKDYKNKVKEKAKDKESDETRVNNLIDVADDDDFLLYLEDILSKMHETFFREYDRNKSQRVDGKEIELPDLKRLVPKVRRDVLRGINIVFSGVIPQQVRLKDSKAYQIAICFGATVSERLVIKAKGDSEKKGQGNIPYTTHLVAANVSTEKVHRARRCKSIKVVTPNWLWTCVERWELVEERLFPLTKEGEKNVQRQPPHHCFCPDMSLYQSPAIDAVPGPSGRTRTPSGNLLEDVNPLLFFSPDDKNSMAFEVDMMLSEEDGSNGGEDQDSSSDDEESGPDRKKHRRLERNLESDSSSSSDRQTDEELPSKVFREGGGLPSDDSDGGLSDEDDLSRMGADLESLLD